MIKKDLNELKKIKEEVENVVIVEKTEKETLLELYQTLKDLGVNSISDLENKIANLK